jgi:hypothetical protein
MRTQLAMEPRNNAIRGFLFEKGNIKTSSTDLDYLPEEDLTHSLTRTHLAICSGNWNARIINPLI